MKFENGFSIPENLMSVQESDLLGEFYMVSPEFSFNGRSAEEYEHIWEYDDLTKVVYSEGAYTIRGCVDFEPDCVVLFHNDEPVGFYMGGQAWIDEEHRGQGYGAKMVVASIAMAGRFPEVRYMGFTEEGYRAHMRAIDIIREIHSLSPQTP